MPETAVDLGKNPNDAPRSALRLVQAAFNLYRRFPLLFFVLASGVIAPYELVVLASTGRGPFAQGSLSFGVESLLTLIEWVLIGPLISALHVHAVAEVREGQNPRLIPIARRGLRVLPVVAAASIISGLGIAGGLVLLVLPGIFLLLRWSVVAQAAAIEHEGWLAALRSSHRFTEDHYGHIFVFAICVGLITFMPTFLLALAFGHQTTTVASFMVGLLVRVLTASFGALASALLYYDLRSRHEARVALAPALSSSDQVHIDRSWDPRDYSDQDRPRGWYIDPSSPHRMRYWGAEEPPGWGASTRTPRKIKRAWEADNDQAQGADNDEAQIDHSWDPRDYSDQDRPRGWYIDPSSPHRMRYWGAEEPPSWGSSTRTPRKIRREWEAGDES